MSGPARGAPARLPRGLVLAAAALLATMVAFLLAGVTVGAWWFLTPEGLARRHDFLAFWTAARLALGGDAAGAYDPGVFVAAYEASGGRGFALPLGWHNPPHFLIFLVPFALLPYPAAFLAWTAATALAFALAIRRVLPGLDGAPVVALALPAGFLCAWQGQNAFLVAALFGLGFAALPTRPGWAGFWLGLVSVKPHLGLLLPVLLGVSGQWRCFLAATATLAGAVTASAVLFGPDVWTAFLGSIGATGAAYLGDFRPDTLQSVYAIAARAFGPGAAAVAAHASVALAAAVTAVAVWRRDAPPEARAAAAIGAGFLLPPYVFQYDTVAIGIAAAFLLRLGLSEGWSRGDVALLLLAVSLPVTSILTRTGLPGPVGYAIVLLVAARRGLARSRRAAHRSAP